MERLENLLKNSLQQILFLLIFFDEDKTKLENKKNILDCLNDESISDYVNLYISPGIQLKKYFSTSCIGKLNYISDLDLFFKIINL